MSLSSIITNFTAGVLSPRLDGRVDFARYFNAAKTLYNMIILPQGGATRRAGTVFIESTRNGASACRLVPFNFSNEQAYMLEFGHQYIRFFANQGVVLNSGATGPYEVATTINEASLPYLRYSQSGDTMYLVSAQGDMPSAKLVRSGNISWAISNISFTQNPFNGATTTGYPKAVGFFEQRSIWANTRGDPQKYWMSQTALYEDLSVGMADDEAIAITIAADNVNPVLWLASMKALLCGTGGGEWRIGSDSYVEPITPTNIIAKRESNWGAEDAMPVVVGRAVLYIQRHWRKIRELVYSEVEETKSTDLSILAEHLTNPGSNGSTIVELVFQQEPDSIVWARQHDGRFLGLTYNRAQEVIGWHQHETDGIVESIAVIPGEERDELWLVVKRTINNQATRFIELMAPTDFVEQNDAWYVDCGLQYTGSGATTLAGLGHLNGASVDVLADGGVIARTTVNAGSIVLENLASNVIVGLPYESLLQTMRIEAQTKESQSVQTRKKKIVSVALRVYRSGPFDAGFSENSMDVVPMRTAGDLMGTAAPLYTGDKEIKMFRSNWDRDGYVWVKTDKPLPLTVLAIVPKWKTENV